MFKEVTDILALIFSSYLNHCQKLTLRSPGLTLREIPLYTLSFKTVYSQLRTVNVTRLLKITEFCKWVLRILPFTSRSKRNNAYCKRE